MRRFFDFCRWHRHNQYDGRWNGTLLIAVLFSMFISLLHFPVSMPASCKESSSTIALPPPSMKGSFPLDRALAERRSLRQFKNSSISREELSMLLWACQGQTDDKGHRTAPSAIAAYPLELYVIVGQVKDLTPGVYRYVSKGHQIIAVMEGDRREDFINSAAPKQVWVRSAPVIFVITGVAEKITRKTGDKGRRFLYVEAGLAAQNLFLEAVSLSLGGTFVGGFEPEAVQSYLKLPAGEEPMAVIPVGKKP